MLVKKISNLNFESQQMLRDNEYSLLSMNKNAAEKSFTGQLFFNLQKNKNG